jgi:hypothetical protein
VSDKREGQKPVSTVHLGQYTRGTANEIAGELEQAGIVWWYKEPGWLAAVWEFGVRLFVDRERLDEARAIAERVTAKREARRAAGQDPDAEQPPGPGGNDPGPA